jgi:DNA polymerase-3 subunit gamma/tau
MYLTGKSGSGKTTLALIITAALRCDTPNSDGFACGKCESCLELQSDNKFAEGLYKFNAAELTADDMSRLLDITSTKTFSGKPKIIFIDEFQRLQQNTKAHDFLLTELEKERSDVYWILGSMQDAKVSKAIKRRAVTYRMEEPSPEEIGKYLLTIADKEGVKLDKSQLEVFKMLAYSCDGSVGLALAWLDRCIVSELWSVEDVQKSIGIVSHETYLDFLKLILDGNKKAFTVLNNIRETEDVQSTFAEITKILLSAYKIINGVETSYDYIIAQDIKDFPPERIELMFEMAMDLKNATFITHEMLTFKMIQFIKKIRVLSKDSVSSTPVITRRIVKREEN